MALLFWQLVVQCAQSEKFILRGKDRKHGVGVEEGPACSKNEKERKASQKLQSLSANCFSLALLS